MIHIVGNIASISIGNSARNVGVSIPDGKSFSTIQPTALHLVT